MIYVTNKTASSKKKRKLANRMKHKYRIMDLNGLDYDFLEEREVVRQEAATPDTPFRTPVVCQECPSPDAESDHGLDDVAKELNFSPGVFYSILFTTVEAQARAAKVLNELTHVNCDCDFCKVSNLKFAPALKSGGGGWTPEIAVGDLMVADLCTDLAPDRDGHTVMFVARDVAVSYTHLTLPTILLV